MPVLHGKHCDEWYVHDLLRAGTAVPPFWDLLLCISPLLASMVNSWLECCRMSLNVAEAMKGDSLSWLPFPLLLLAARDQHFAAALPYFPPRRYGVCNCLWHQHWFLVNVVPFDYTLLTVSGAFGDCSTTHLPLSFNDNFFENKMHVFALNLALCDIILCCTFPAGTKISHFYLFTLGTWPRFWDQGWHCLACIYTTWHLVIAIPPCWCCGCFCRGGTSPHFFFQLCCGSTVHSYLFSTWSCRNYMAWPPIFPQFTLVEIAIRFIGQCSFHSRILSCPAGGTLGNLCPCILCALTVMICNHFECLQTWFETQL